MDEFHNLMNQIQTIASGFETIQSPDQVNRILNSSELKNIPVSLLIQFFEKIPENYKKQINHCYVYDMVKMNFQTLSPLLAYIDFGELTNEQQMEIIYNPEAHFFKEISIPQNYFKNLKKRNKEKELLISQQVLTLISNMNMKLLEQEALIQQQQLFSTNFIKFLNIKREVKNLQKNILLIGLKCRNIFSYYFVYQFHSVSFYYYTTIYCLSCTKDDFEFIKFLIDNKIMLDDLNKYMLIILLFF